MASRRKLKKGIHEITDFVIDDILILAGLLEDPNDKDKETLKELEDYLNQIIDLQEEALSKASNTDGSQNRQLVKAHYTNLIEKFNQGLEKIDEGLIALTEKMKL